MAVGTYLPYSETFIYDQLLHARKFEPFVWARELSKDFGGRFPYENVTGLAPFERLKYALCLGSRTFARELAGRELQFIHAHFGLNGTLVTPLARSSGKPLAVTFHGIDVGVLLGKKVPLAYSVYARNLGKMFETAELLLPASEELANGLVSLGAPQEKIRVHRLGIDLEKFKPLARPERGVRFLMCGRMVEKKGFDFGIRAFAKIAEKFPDATLNLIGKGPLEAALRNLAAECGVGKRVRFLGAIDTFLMPNVFGEFDVFLAPCVVAGNGDRDSGLLVLKEAGATGMAAVGTFCGGLPEIIDAERSGFLVPQRNVAELAEAMEALANDYQLRQSMGECARAKMERDYDTLRQNERLENFFGQLI